MGLEVDCFSAEDIQKGSFHQKLQTQLALGFIRYHQVYHLDHEPRKDNFALQATDGEFKSREVELRVLIKPTNDEAPELSVDPAFCQEGNICDIRKGHQSVPKCL